MTRLRPNVALLLLDPEDLLLVCERARIKGAWQFPQGGVDPGESLEEALVREVEEEIGLPPAAYDIERQGGGYRYFYPSGMVKKKAGWFDGQEQTYFLCRLHGDAPPLDLTSHSREFSDYKWIKPGDFVIEWLPPFKREVYAEVMQDFFGVDL